MNQFVELYNSLQRPISSSQKAIYLVDYFKQALPQDIMWTLSFLLNHPQSRIVKSTEITKWAEANINLPNWLLEQSYQQVGDKVETISILVPQSTQTKKTISQWMSDITEISNADKTSIRFFVTSVWAGLSGSERYVFNKIILGNLRVNVDQKIVIQALALIIGKEKNKVALRLQKPWSAIETTFEELLVNGDWEKGISRHYPFTHHELINVEELSLDPSDYWITWDHDGLSTQLIIRDQEVYLWSNNEEFVTSKFPEFKQLKKFDLDNFTIEGKVVIFKNGEIQENSILEKRMKKKKVTNRDLKDLPAIFIATDILEYKGQSKQHLPIVERRKLLTQLIEMVNSHFQGVIFISELLKPSSWDILKKFRHLSKAQKASGLLLAFNHSESKDEKIWKWEPLPLTIKAVLLYAEKGQAHASNDFNELTFAVWKNDEELIPIGKSKNTLNAADCAELKEFVKKNTIEKFGPVRSLRPALIFQISFTQVHKSTRRKSGLTLDNLKIINWEKEKEVNSADHLSELTALIS